MIISDSVIILFRFLSILTITKYKWPTLSNIFFGKSEHLQKFKITDEMESNVEYLKNCLRVNFKLHRCRDRRD